MTRCVTAKMRVRLRTSNPCRIVASAAAQAFDYIGLPEGIYPIVEATLYLATAPKSNSAKAFFEALAGGYRRALSEAGVSSPADFVLETSLSPQGGYDAAEALLKLPVRPTAIFT